MATCSMVWAVMRVCAMDGRLRGSWTRTGTGLACLHLPCLLVSNPRYGQEPASCRLALLAPLCRANRLSPLVSLFSGISAMTGAREQTDQPTYLRLRYKRIHWANVLVPMAYAIGHNSALHRVGRGCTTVSLLRCAAAEQLRKGFLPNYVRVPQA